MLNSKSRFVKRNEGTNDRSMPNKKNNGKFSSDNLDKELETYWGKDHKDTSKPCLLWYIHENVLF